MTIETIKQQLVEAGKFSVNSTYSLFAVRIELIADVSRKFSIVVEYPCHRDGEFVSYPCEGLSEACAVFKFANAMLDDIRAAIADII